MLWVFVCLILFCSVLQAQQPVPLRITHRVDTTNSETKEILGLWMSYLNNSPTELRKHFEWNSAEQLTFPDADLTRVWVFQSDSMLRAYPPTVLSIEPAGSFRVIRTMFSSRDESGMIVPLAIHRVYAQLEYGVWKLKSAHSLLTRQWKYSTFGTLKVYYPPEATINPSLARRAAKFCDSLSAQFGIASRGLSLYVCESPDELARVIGLDYFAHPPYGITYRENMIIFSGSGTPWHPHELVHGVFAEYTNAHTMITEGIATWLGGSLGDSFDKLVLDMQDSLKQGVRISLPTILANQTFYSTELYTLGGLLCNAAYALGGSESVRLLLSSGTTDQELYATLSRMFALDTTTIDSFLERLVRTYPRSE